MFFAWLVAAGVQLVGAAGVFAIARTRTVSGLTIAILAGPIGVLLFAPSPLLFLNGLVLAAIGIACTCLKARERVFAAFAITASVTIMGLAGSVGVWSWAGLKERYPFESMSPRLAYEEKRGRQAGLDSPTLTDSTRKRLKEVEERRFWNSRSQALHLVHASYIEQFVSSPGFGVGRMIRPSPDDIEFGDKRATRLFVADSRPDLDGTSDRAAAESEPAPPATLVGPLDELHYEARDSFLDPNGFGYVRDRDRVAGFVPHGFLNDKPWMFTGDRRTRWLTVRVDLVSLLKHDRPMAYVSKHLPNMSELREAPVRELDTFEQQAVTSLFAGEDLVSDAHPGRIQAVGSLRATRQCLDCHQVERGALLGAFSYEFLSDPPAPRLRKSDPDSHEKLL